MSIRSKNRLSQAIPDHVSENELINVFIDDNLGTKYHLLPYQHILNRSTGFVQQFQFLDHGLTCPGLCHNAPLRIGLRADGAVLLFGDQGVVVIENLLRLTVEHKLSLIEQHSTIAK
ncbi:hypothetical protein G6F65_022388 [Rhizopus arrhizus]|nr:hypothetical protein G6F65_022388 [Rhizopus arrhizus]